MYLMNRNNIICALDYDNDVQAIQMAEELIEYVGIFKVGLQLYTASGSTILSKLCSHKIPIFLDLKFHDIPNTVYKTIQNFQKFNKFNHTIKMLTVHAAGEEKMIKAAVEAAEDIDVIAVTRLTSLNSRTFKTIANYTEMALAAGAAGVVCSVHEIRNLRKKFGNDFKIIVPGIRPEWYQAVDDQKQTGTPAEAMKAGANYIVIGRPITNSTYPKNAAYNIHKEIE